MLLIQNAAHVIVSADEVLRDTDVLVDGNHIAQVGKNLPAENCGRVIDATGKILLPGFVNAHTHLYQSMLKGMGDSLRLKEWCEAVTFPFSNVIHHYNRQLGDQSLGYAYGMLGAIEMLQSGITAFIDMDTVMDSLLQAWQDVGIRGVAAVQSVNRWVPKELMIPDDVRLQKLEETILKWHGNGLQDVYIAPSTPFTCTPEFMCELQKLARKHNVKIQTHVSETKWEVQQSIDEVGMTPLAYLESIGFLEDPIIAVHGIHLTPEEMALCKKRGVTVCYNPKSNGKLGSGIAPIAELRDMGVDLCIATDGAASNDLLDMFEDMRFGSMLQKLKYEDPGLFGEKDVFRMATEGGAKALGLNAGRIEKGKLADLVLMNVSAPAMPPLHDPISALVYCGKSCDVETVVIDGRVVMENHRILTVDANRELQKAVELGAARCAEVSGRPMGAAF